MKKVSIIVPVYGVEDYIEKFARTLFSQSYSNLDIIFVNDCTQDNSIQILQKIMDEFPDIKPHTRILNNEFNRGVSYSRQKGLEAAIGDYVIQLDSDDFLDVNMISILVAKAEEEDSDIVFCDYNVIEGSQVEHIAVHPSSSPIKSMEMILSGELLGTLWNKLIKRDIFTRNNIFFEDNLNLREDLSVVYKILFFSKRISWVNKSLYNYVVRKGSITSVLMSTSHQNDTYKIILNMNKFCKENHINDAEVLNYFTFFKAQVLCYILLYGNIENIPYDLFKDVKCKHFFKHPKLPIYQKCLFFFLYTKNKTIVRLYRFLLFKIKYLYKLSFSSCIV